MLVIQLRTAKLWDHDYMWTLIMFLSFVVKFKLIAMVTMIFKPIFEKQGFHKEFACIVNL